MKSGEILIHWHYLMIFSLSFPCVSVFNVRHFHSSNSSGCYVLGTCSCSYLDWMIWLSI